MAPRSNGSELMVKNSDSRTKGGDKLHHGPISKFPLLLL